MPAAGSIQLWGAGWASVLLLALIVAQLLARHITQPLHRLVEATGELARGNFDIRIDLATGDEMEDLSKKFEAMAGEIRVRQQQVEATNQDLARLNAGLEEEVRKRTQALLEAEEKYRILVESSPNPICILQRGRVAFFNRAFRQAFGYSAEELQRPGFDFLRSWIPRAGARWKPLLGGNGRRGQRRKSTEIVAQPKSRHPHPSGYALHLDFLRGRAGPGGHPRGRHRAPKLQEQVVSYERLRALGRWRAVCPRFQQCSGRDPGPGEMLQRSRPSPRLLRGSRSSRRRLATARKR
jgi:PAS domain-containing protein